MKSKLLAVLFLAGGSLFGGVSVGVGVNFGGPGYFVPPPPPPRAAYYGRPAIPGPGYVWINGFWNLNRGHYAWQNGYWARPPYRGGYWVAPRHDGRRYYGGYWRR